MNANALIAEIEADQRRQNAEIEAVKTGIRNSSLKTVVEVGAALNRACRSDVAAWLQDEWRRNGGN